MPTAYALHTQLQRCVALRMRIRLHLMLKMRACPTAFTHGLLAKHLFSCERVHHEVLTYRVQSSVWRLPNYTPPTPSPPSECVLPPHQRRGVHTRRVVRRWRVNISEDARHWIGLLQHNPSTGCTNHAICTVHIMCLWRMKRLYNKIYRISFPAVYSTSVEDLSFIKTYIELVFYVYVYVYRMLTYIFHLFVFCLRNCGITKVIWIILSKPSVVKTSALQYEHKSVSLAFTSMLAYRC
jgi:hypothetical protein